MGVLEGYLTSTRIGQNAITMSLYWNLGEKEEKIKQFFQDQYTWAKEQVASNKKDSYWINVGYILAQFDGIIYGAKQSNPAITDWDLVLLNGIGDLIDLTRALFPSERPDVPSMEYPDFLKMKHETGHCSALVRVLPGFEDIYMGHSSWFYYGATNRIYKHYHFDVSEETISSKSISFSSYAGYLESLDDFYIMSNGLVMLQTTINCLNQTLYSQVKPVSTILLYPHNEKIIFSKVFYHGNEFE